jgi:hypothetical protein
MSIDLIIKTPVGHPRRDEVLEMMGGRVGLQGVHRSGGGFGVAAGPGVDGRAGRVYPYIQGITSSSGAIGFVTPVTGAGVWRNFQRYAGGRGIEEEEVGADGMSPAEIGALRVLRRRGHLVFPLRRIRVGANVWLYLGDDDRLGERVSQKRRGQRRGYRVAGK